MRVCPASAARPKECRPRFTFKADEDRIQCESLSALFLEGKRRIHIRTTFPPLGEGRWLGEQSRPPPSYPRLGSDHGGSKWQPHELWYRPYVCFHLVSALAAWQCALVRSRLKHGCSGTPHIARQLVAILLYAPDTDRADASCKVCVLVFMKIIRFEFAAESIQRE
jgi:hypothetical protein